jgi:hypothetical protein
MLEAELSTLEPASTSLDGGSSELGEDSSAALLERPSTLLLAELAALLLERPSTLLLAELAALLLERPSTLLLDEPAELLLESCEELGVVAAGAAGGCGRGTWRQKWNHWSRPVAASWGK